MSQSTHLVTGYLCGMSVRAPPREPWLLLHRGYTGGTLWLCYVRLCHGYVKATLWLCCGFCYSCRTSQERGCVMAAHQPGDNEPVCSSFGWLLESPSSLLARALPTLGSVNSVNSKTIGLTDRIRDTRHCWKVYNHDKKKKSTQHLLGRSLEKIKVLHICVPLIVY